MAIKINNFAVFLKETVDNVTPYTLDKTLIQFHTMHEELDLINNVYRNCDLSNFTMLATIYRDRVGNNISNPYYACMYQIIRTTRASAWSVVADVDATFLLENANKIFQEYYKLLKAK